MIIWKSVALTVLLPFMILLVISSVRLWKTSQPTPTASRNVILEQLDTGDLLFVRYHSKHGYLIRAGTGDVWSHTALVCKHPYTTEISIIEMADYTEYSHDNVEGLCGLCIVPLQQWLELNEDRLCGYRRCKHRPTFQQIQRAINGHNATQLDMDLRNWAKTLVWLKSNSDEPPNKTHYFCSEFIAMILQKLGLLDSEYSASCYSPARLARSNDNHYKNIVIFNL